MARLHDAFDTVDQHGLVQCVWAMRLYRSHLLGLKHPHNARIQHQPTNDIPTDVPRWCQSDFSLDPDGLVCARLSCLRASLLVLAASVCLCVCHLMDSDPARHRL